MVRISARILLVIAWLFPLLAGAEQPCRETTEKIPPIGLQEFALGFRNPVHIASPPGDRSLVFVIEQAGTIRIVENGRVRKDIFLDLHDVVESGGEKGLLGIAFHPQYAQNGLFYVDYTTGQGGLHTIISRFQRATPYRADRTSEIVLFKIKQPYPNHKGGQLAFGPDGFLYIGMGDGGSGNDPHNNGQRLDTLLGKLLRVDVDHEEAGKHYAIPPDNPFLKQPGAFPEIYAYGLRNPWRFSFDALTKRLYLADVGQYEVEEIDVIEKGGNYGWRVMEGDICTPGVNPVCDSRGFIPPIATYHHPVGFSIIGGFVYRGDTNPALCGTYLYADYVTKRIWGLRYDGKKVVSQRELLQTPYAISTFGEDAANELYLADHQSGKIFRIVSAR